MSGLFYQCPECESLVEIDQFADHRGIHDAIGLGLVSW